MVSVTSASHYQSRPSMYILGVIPQNWQGSSDYKAAVCSKAIILLCVLVASAVCTRVISNRMTQKHF